jgi:hypothetical protein
MRRIAQRAGLPEDLPNKRYHIFIVRYIPLFEKEKIMQPVTIEISGYAIDFEQARQLAESLALRDNEFATLVSWNDREKGVHSPQCLKCEIKGDPGWEVYGRNHGGRLRISFNDDAYVLIYS